MTRKRGKYIPNKQYSPIVRSKKIDRISDEIGKFKQVIDMISMSNESYVSYMTNFARHDMKNAIQSMDSILTTTEPAEYTEETVLALKEYLLMLRSSLDNFSKLVPYSNDGRFTIGNLMLAVELYTRSDLTKAETVYILQYPRTSEILLERPFHSIIQAIHNMILNSLQALKGVEGKKLIRIIADINENICTIKIADNGKPILPDIEPKVFEFMFSTTGGTGVGLFHAQYLFNKLDGSVSLVCTPEEEFTKEFTLTFPISPANPHEENSSSN